MDPGIAAINEWIANSFDNQHDNAPSLAAGWLRSRPRCVSCDVHASTCRLASLLARAAQAAIARGEDVSHPLLKIPPLHLSPLPSKKKTKKAPKAPVPIRRAS